jgi:hypothetical protein
MTTIVRPGLDFGYESSTLSTKREEESMPSPFGADVLPMPPKAPEVARAFGLPRAAVWRAAGSIALRAGAGEFFGRAADHRRPTAGLASAAEGGPKALTCNGEFPPRRAATTAAAMFHRPLRWNESGRGWNKSPGAWNRSAGCWNEKRVS